MHILLILYLFGCSAIELPLSCSTLNAQMRQALTFTDVFVFVCKSSVQQCIPEKVFCRDNPVNVTYGVRFDNNNATRSFEVQNFKTQANSPYSPFLSMYVIEKLEYLSFNYFVETSEWIRLAVELISNWRLLECYYKY